MRYVVTEGTKARTSWYVAEDGHIYLKKATKGSRFYVRCLHERNKIGLRCASTGVIDGDQLTVNKDHNHGPTKEYLEAAQTYTSLRNKARESAGILRASDIIDEVAREEGATLFYPNAIQMIKRVRQNNSGPWSPSSAPAVTASPAARPAQPLNWVKSAGTADGGNKISFTVVVKDEKGFETSETFHAEGDSPDHGPQTLSDPGGDGEEQQEIETVEEHQEIETAEEHQEIESIEVQQEIDTKEEQLEIDAIEEQLEIDAIKEQEIETVEVPAPLEEAGQSDQSDLEDPLGASVQELSGGGAEVEAGSVRVRGVAAAPPSIPKRAYPRRQYAAKRAKTVDRSRDERIIQALDELARREEDPDRNFLLSLLPYLKKMPDDVRLRAKTHLLNHVTECSYPAE